MTKTTDHSANPPDAVLASVAEAAPLETLPRGTVERLEKEAGWLVPAIVARAFVAAGVGLRVKVLRRLLPAVGPLALTVVGGGAFAR